jgi:hypothetical protein
MRRAGLLLLILACAIGVVGWNVSRFAQTRMVPRTKDLAFLPPPALARALSLGQPTTVAKLRWIDSFAYFQLQMERQNDTVAGGGPSGGFQRLYDTLIALDPSFVPFYQHAVLTTGGVLGQHRLALGYALRGTQALPVDAGMWRQAAAELAVSFRWKQRQPASMEAFLQGWEAAEPTEEGKQLVRDWRRGLAFERVEGLETLPYWLSQLKSTNPDTALGRFVDDTVRELLAAHAVKELPHLLRDSLLPVLDEGHLDPERIRARYPQGPPPWGPVVVQEGRLRLRQDPFGYPFLRQADGTVQSQGLEQRRFPRRLNPVRQAIAQEARKRGTPPHDAAEAAAWGFALPPPPFQGRWDFTADLPDVVWISPPQQSWVLR